MRLLAMAGAAILMLGMTSAAGASEPSDATKEKKVCKSEKITGSLTRVRRVCLTQREWDRISVDVNRTLNRLGRSAAEAESLKHNPAAAASAMSGT